MKNDVSYSFSIGSDQAIKAGLRLLRVGIISFLLRNRTIVTTYFEGTSAKPKHN